MKLELLSPAPLVASCDDVLSQRELDDLARRATDRHWLAGRGVSVRLDETGLSWHAHRETVPELHEVGDRIDALLGGAFSLRTVRVRCYAQGQGHPVHGDHHEIDGDQLLVTAMLCLRAPEGGGATRFARADLSIAPRRNRLVVWANHLEDGREDPATHHEGEAVEQGEKIVVLFLFYGSIERVPALRRVIAGQEVNA